MLFRSGQPAELYERPDTVFTARFVGTPPMNVLPPSVLAGLGDGVLASAPRGHPADALALGVRAEAARLAPSGAPARVVAIEYLGADTLLDTRIGDEPFIVRVAGRPAVTAGDNVSIAWDAGAAHWFDATSGKRIG